MSLDAWSSGPPGDEREPWAPEQRLAERVAAFRRERRRDPFEVRVLRLEPSLTNPVRLGPVILQPLLAPELEAWAEPPPWLEVFGDSDREGSQVEGLFAATLASRHDELGAVLLARCRTGREARDRPEVVLVELLAPFETRLNLSAAGGPERLVRHLGYTDRRRVHAKTFKHVFAMGREADVTRSGWTPLTAVAAAPEAGSTRVASPELLGLRQAGCSLARARDALRHEEDYLRYCRGCPTSTVLQVDPAISAGARLLGELTREAVNGATAVIDLPATGELGFADERGVVHFSRRAQAPGSALDVQEGTTTYLAAPRGRRAPNSCARKEAALRVLERDVRRGGSRASWLRSNS